jgi:multisubunit Na+/H+ antiporter MnhG subunit
MDEEYATVSLVQFLFGVFCAHWAQNTSRSAWLWFFLGWILAPVTGVLLLIKTGKPVLGSLN